MTPIHFLRSLIQLIDNSKLRYGILDILQDSLLIPKPKFKVGDITLPKGAKQAFQVDLRNYNLPFGNWAYYDTQTGVWWWEQELELVERKEDEATATGLSTESRK